MSSARASFFSGFYILFIHDHLLKKAMPVWWFILLLFWFTCKHNMCGKYAERQLHNGYHCRCWPRWSSGVLGVCAHLLNHWLLTELWLGCAFVVYTRCSTSHDLLHWHIRNNLLKQDATFSELFPCLVLVLSQFSRDMWRIYIHLYPFNFTVILISDEATFTSIRGYLPYALG